MSVEAIKCTLLRTSSLQGLQPQASKSGKSHLFCSHISFENLSCVFPGPYFTLEPQNHYRDIKWSKIKLLVSEKLFIWLPWVLANIYTSLAIFMNCRRTKGQDLKNKICLGVGIMWLNIYNDLFVFWIINSPLFSSKWIEQQYQRWWGRYVCYRAFMSVYCCVNLILW